MSETRHNAGQRSFMKRIPFYTFRKRHNPLYEEEKDAMVPKKSKPQSGLCQCPCLAMLIFSLVVSLVAIILVLLLVAGVMSTSNSSSGKFDCYRGHTECF